MTTNDRCPWCAAAGVVRRAFVSSCLLLVACNSNNAPQSRTVDQTAITQQIADIDKKIAALAKQKQAISDEVARREALWRKQVSARHPDWSPEKRERQLTILSEKWRNSNRSVDADTVDRMKKFGSRVWHDVDLAEQDYWDITRALRFLIDRYDLEREISAQLQPLQEAKQRLSKSLDN